MKDFKKVNSKDLDVYNPRYIKLNPDQYISTKSTSYLTNEQLNQYRFSTITKCIYKWNRFIGSKDTL